MLTINLRPPRAGTAFGRVSKYLALFHEIRNTKDYWCAHWDEKSRASLVRSGREGVLPEFGPLILKHAPWDLPVLEAGCGPAHIVAALARLGYRVTGVDYEPDVVRFVTSVMPDLDVRLGDVNSLEMESGSIGCYISIGVAEHFIEGPERTLTEARRVLHNKGVALISVPYLNSTRRKYLNHVHRNWSPPLGLHFYQYYFSEDDFKEQLRKAGFRIAAVYLYGSMTFLTREHPIFGRYWNSIACREFMKPTLRSSIRKTLGTMEKRYSHMIMAVCHPI